MSRSAFLLFSGFLFLGFFHPASIGDFYFHARHKQEFPVEPFTPYRWHVADPFAPPPKT